MYFFYVGGGKNGRMKPFFILGLWVVFLETDCKIHPSFPSRSPHGPPLHPSKTSPKHPSPPPSNPKSTSPQQIPSLSSTSHPLQTKSPHRNPILPRKPFSAFSQVSKDLSTTSHSTTVKSWPKSPNSYPQASFPV